MRLRNYYVRFALGTLGWRIPGLNGMAWRRGIWVRFGRRGPGFSVKARRDHVPLFSERHGFSPRARYVGPVAFKRVRRLRDDADLQRHVAEVLDAYRRLSRRETT